MMPQTSLSGRIAAMEKFVAKLKTKRDAIVNVLMWEICKVCVRVCVRAKYAKTAYLRGASTRNT